MLRQGEGAPLLLLHGLTGSEILWRPVMALLAERHDVIAPTALGHVGGRPAETRPARVEHLLDDTERTMDELGLESAHLAGNSLGGWMALELARRGRARSVTALSPAGTWDNASPEHKRTRAYLRRSLEDARRTRPLLPLLFRIPAMRRFGLRSQAVHGDRVAASDLLAITDASLACEVRDDLLDTPESVAPLDPAPCPITIAWSGEDRVLPLTVNGVRAQALVPGARFVVLDDVGHVPMFDDPALVAATILETTGG